MFVTGQRESNYRSRRKHRNGNSNKELLHINIQHNNVQQTEILIWQQNNLWSTLLLYSYRVGQ